MTGMKKTVAVIFVVMAMLCFCSVFGQNEEEKRIDMQAPEAPAPVSTAAPVPCEEMSATAELPAALPDSAESPEPSAAASPAPPEVTPFVKPLPEAVTYSDGEVSAGTVRYVSQLNEPEKNGWGKYTWKAGMECTTACVSMAMSFIGIDASPEALLDYSSKTVLTGCFGVEGIEPSQYSSSFYEKGEAYPAFKKMAEEYLSDNGTEVSPVLVYLTGSGHYHAFLVIGKGESNVWYVLDPTPAGIHTVRITDEGKITTDEEDYLTRYTTGEESPASIVSLAQWRLCGEEEKT